MKPQKMKAKVSSLEHYKYHHLIINIFLVMLFLTMATLCNVRK